jgi:hypothetical protein
MEHNPMAADVKSPVERMADLNYAIHLMLTGQSDPAFTASVRAKAAKITDQIRERHGVLNVAVDLIREARDEE